MPVPRFGRSSEDYGDAVASLKARFRELDKNRDGMLDRSELAVLLRRGMPDISDREIRGLFLNVDKDGSGAVLFDEFVDFLFRPPTSKDMPEDSRTVKFSDTAETPRMQLALKRQEHEVQSVEICGASFHPELNGVYTRKPTLVNGLPVFSSSEPSGHLFYGWTQGRHRVGWFATGKAPSRGPVLTYKVFNPSPLAETPNLCCAMWETPGGNRDKRMFCECLESTKEMLDHFGGVNEYDSDVLENELCTHGLLTSLNSFSAELGLEDNGNRKWEEEIGEDVEDFEGAEPYSYEFEWMDGVEQKAPSKMVDVSRQPFVDDFLDSDFPPEEQSLGSSMGFHDMDTSSCVADCWRRLPQLHETPCLFRRGVAPDDVCSSDSAANRWFLSACCVVAEFPAWVRSMFGRTTELDPEGRYGIRLYHPGKNEFVRITVDDFVPTKCGFPAFAGITVDGEIWVSLVEKAFAKMCGSYANTNGGCSAFGMLYLCGGGIAESWSVVGENRWRRSQTFWNHGAAPKSSTINRKLAETLVNDGALCSNNEIWSMLRDFVGMSYPVACTIDGTQMAASGLSSDRTYPLISAREVCVNGRILRMVFLRDPFGVSGWRGRWSNTSETWRRNTVVRKALGFDPVGDGTFWMAFSDFLRYFHIFDVVKKPMPLQGCHKVKLSEFRKSLTACLSFCLQNPMQSP